jgi:NAD-dependent SIR2 family protein deacetylase
MDIAPSAWPRNAVPHAAKLLGEADGIILTAGAGIGVDSGLPDFRGNEGFWKAYPALAKAGIGFTSIASPRSFQRSPRLAWGFYGHRLALYRSIDPHKGFDVLRHWGSKTRMGTWIYTSNVDGHFQKSGFSGAMINECHGSIHHLQCLEGCTPEVWSADDFIPEVDNDTCQVLNDLPTCPHCGGLARPNIVMFGDNGWLPQRSLPQRANQAAWLEHAKSTKARLVVIEVGAGSVIASVRDFGRRMCDEMGANMIRINPREFQVEGRGDVGIPARSLSGINAIDAFLMRP